MNLVPRGLEGRKRHGSRGKQCHSDLSKMR